MINSNETLKTPILFLVFNRPSCTEKVFKAIAAARPTKLYVAADGARLNRLGETDLCAQVRSIATKVDWECDVDGGEFLYEDKKIPLSPGQFVVFNPRKVHRSADIISDKKRFGIDFTVKRKK